jgi:hypothetical protein
MATDHSGMDRMAVKTLRLFIGIIFRNSFGTSKKTAANFFPLGCDTAWSHRYSEQYTVTIFRNEDGENREQRRHLYRRENL